MGGVIIITCNEINEIMKEYFERKVITAYLSYFVTSSVKKVFYTLVNTEALEPQNNGGRNEISVEETAVTLVGRERAEDLLSAFKFNKRRNEKEEYIAIRAHFVLQMTEQKT
jgi:hypothetical protein